MVLDIEDHLEVALAVWYPSVYQKNPVFIIRARIFERKEKLSGFFVVVVIILFNLLKKYSGWVFCLQCVYAVFVYPVPEGRRGHYNWR